MDDHITMWFYFFSSVAQGNAALLSVAGVFVVLRLQSLDTLRAALDNRIESFVRDFMKSPDGRPIPIPYLHVGELQKVITQMSNGDIKPTVHSKDVAADLRRQAVFDGYFEFRKSIDAARFLMVREVKFPAIALAGAMLLALVLLTSGDFFSTYQRLIVWLMILLEIGSVWTLIRYAYKALRGKGYW